jgi:prostaglandin-H2 D-isomerase / glutathione transferase
MLKLCYFNGRGLAETSRMILAVAGAEYEDFRYPLEVIDWATFNMVREEFNKDKAEGKLEKSMGKVPFLVVKDSVETTLCQSKAIERYLARRFGFMGGNDLEAAQIDSLCECIRDFKDAYQPVRKMENKEEAMQKWFGETLVGKLSDFEKLLGDSGYAIGSSLTLADFVIYSFLVDFFDDKDGIAFSMRSCPKLQKLVETVGANEKLSAWRESRPNTPF